MKRKDFASLFTLRSDGRYVYRWTEDGKRMAIYDRDPAVLFDKVQRRADAAVSSCVEDWQREHSQRVGYKTAEAYRAHAARLVQKFGRVPISALTAPMLQAWLNELAGQGYSRRSVQMARDVANMVCQFAILRGQITVNPVASVSLPRNLPVTHRELPTDAAIEAVKSSTHPFALFAQLCLYSGLRRGEALALTHEDVADGVIHVTKAVEFVGNDPRVKTPKTAAGRRDALLLDVLADLIPPGKGLLFPGKDGKLLTKTAYRKRWESFCKSIGHDLTAHQLRHGYATILFEAGIADKDAQELLGHSSIVLTRNVYTHIRQSRREETAARLNAFFSQKPDTNLDTNR